MTHHAFWSRVLRWFRTARHREATTIADLRRAVQAIPPDLPGSSYCARYLDTLARRVAPHPLNRSRAGGWR